MPHKEGGHVEGSGGNGYVFYLDWSDVSGVYTCVKHMCQIVYIKYIQLSYIIYASINLFLKMKNKKKG
jgi:hypothetical protein